MKTVEDMGLTPILCWACPSFRWPFGGTGLAGQGGGAVKCADRSLAYQMPNTNKIIAVQLPQFCIARKILLSIGQGWTGNFSNKILVYQSHDSQTGWGGAVDRWHLVCQLFPHEKAGSQIKSDPFSAKLCRILSGLVIACADRGGAGLRSAQSLVSSKPRWRTSP